jgi:hypothetical protein
LHIPQNYVNEVSSIVDLKHWILLSKRYRITQNSVEKYAINKSVSLTGCLSEDYLLNKSTVKYKAGSTYGIRYITYQKTELTVNNRSPFLNDPFLKTI